MQPARWAAVGGLEPASVAKGAQWAALRHPRRIQRPSSSNATVVRRCGTRTSVWQMFSNQAGFKGPEFTQGGALYVCYKSDRHGRNVCTMNTRSGENVAPLMLRAGLGCTDPRFANDATILAIVLEKRSNEIAAHGMARVAVLKAKRER